MTTLSDIADSAIERDWATNPRWAGIERSYDAADVIRLRGTVRVEHSLARRGAEQLWRLLHTADYINALGAMTAGQAIEMVNAGLKAIYISGRQDAADANLNDQVDPGQDLFPSSGVPAAVRRVNNALRRADQAEWAESSIAGDARVRRDWLVPIVADAEGGCGGAPNAYELMRSMIEAGAAGVQFEDQLSSEKKCGYMGGTVLVPTGQHIRTLNAARLATDVAGVSSIIIARTESLGAGLLTSDVDERDREFTTGERSPEGLYYVQPGIDMAVARGLAYAPYADLILCETATPDLEEARIFAEQIKAEYPDKLLAYNCSPSFNWRKHLDDDTISRFQRELGAMGYAFQFVTLAGWHALNESAFQLARGYAESGMSAYVELQSREFALEEHGYSATRHQHEVGAGYFDDLASTISGGLATTLALTGSTEERQF